MLKNYFKIAVRNLWRNKIFSFITIFGFALGISCAYYASTYLDRMINIDGNHRLSDRLYIVIYDKFQNGDNTWKTVLNFPSVKHQMEAQFPQVEKIARLNVGYSMLKYGEKAFNESTFFIDTTLFSLIDFEIINGQKTEILKSPTSAMISSKLAKKLFGKINPIGKTIIRNNKEEFVVTAVFRPFERSYFSEVAIFLPYHQMGGDMQNNWNGYSVNTLVLLNKNTDVSALDKQLTPMLRKHRSAPQDGMKEELHLAKFSSIAYNEKINNKTVGAGKTDIIFFTFLVFAILLISCVNYINVTLARAGERAKEVGIRKTVGAGKFQLMLQFVVESCINNLLAGLLALFFIIFILPNVQYWIFSVIPELAMSFVGDYSFLSDFTFWRVFIVVFISGTLICGIYPAIVLSSFDPIMVLKGKIKLGIRSKVTLRNGLLVFQFIASLVLIIFTFSFLINNRFLKSQPVSWQLSNHLIITDPENATSDTLFEENFLKIKQELCKNPNIRTVTYSNAAPGELIFKDFFNRLRLAKSQVLDTKPYSRVWVEYDYITSYRLPLLAGRCFSRSVGTDETAAVMLSDLAAIQMGFKDPTEAVGEIVILDEKQYQIIGILKSFRATPNSRPDPTIFLIYNDKNRLKSDFMYLSYTVETNGNNAAVIQFINDKMKTLYPKRAIDIKTAEDYYNRNFINTSITTRFTGFFSIIALLISCMGLYGLSIFVIRKRSKEIGIRKVLGATEANIVMLVSKSFLKLVCIALALGTIAGIYCMKGFMGQLDSESQVHAPIEWWWFALPALLILLMAAITVSIESLLTAKLNPVKSLRSE
ncbi:MAG TPA: ABC transporter permease [Cytophagaceae bacterium]